MKFQTILSFLLLPLLFAKETGNRFKKPAPESERLETFVRSLTHFEVNKKILETWKKENPGKTVSREQVFKWQKSSEAKIIDHSLMSGLVTPEKNSTHQLQIAKEIIYPDSFLPDRSENEWPMPEAFVSRDLGVYWNTSFLVSQEGELQDYLKSGFLAHFGNHFDEPLVEKTHQPDDVWVPVFQNSKLEGKLVHQADPIKPIQIDLASHPDKAIILFSNSQKRKLPTVESKLRSKNKPITISTRHIKVARPDWEAFSQQRQLNDVAVDSVLWVAKLISQKKASVLHTSSIMLKSKQVGTVENIKEEIYPTDYIRSELPGLRSLDNSPTPVAFDTKNIGLSLEYYPELHCSGYPVIRFISYSSSYHGEAPVHRFFDGKEWMADAWMPRFSFVKQKGMIALVPGKETLVGVSPSIDDQGNADLENRLLFFLKAE